MEVLQEKKKTLVVNLALMEIGLAPIPDGPPVSFFPSFFLPRAADPHWL